MYVRRSWILDDKSQAVELIFPRMTCFVVGSFPALDLNANATAGPQSRPLERLASDEVVQQARGRRHEDLLAVVSLRESAQGIARALSELPIKASVAMVIFPPLPAFALALIKLLFRTKNSGRLIVTLPPLSVGVTPSAADSIRLLTRYTRSVAWISTLPPADCDDDVRISLPANISRLLVAFG